ncbi:MAG: hypothetical protein O9346_00390 [Leptospiraceae bacterium]|nr:hypothetical protein [Leptospiraceae bacterium]MCZ8344848.1 hypothetical protein [Leptospiraceae bacterium]
MGSIPRELRASLLLSGLASWIYLAVSCDVSEASWAALMFCCIQLISSIFIRLTFFRQELSIPGQNPDALHPWSAAKDGNDSLR